MNTENATKKKILLIDDDASLLLTLSDFLQFEGYDVTTADSGEKGLKKLTKLTPDLIILDMSMPGMGGVGFLKEISSADGKPKHPVLVLTARANMAEFFANIDVAGFIAKPCDPDDLLMEVGRIIFLTSGEDAVDANTATQVRRRVLVGEDDRTACGRIANALIGAGFDVDAVFSGPEVVEKAIVDRPDIVVVKALLSSMNGEAIARMMAEMPKTRDIPLLIYDDGGANVRDMKISVTPGGIKKLLTSAQPIAILDGVREIML